MALVSDDSRLLDALARRRYRVQGSFSYEPYEKYLENVGASRSFVRQSESATW